MAKGKANVERGKDADLEARLRRIEARLADMAEAVDGRENGRIVCRCKCAGSNEVRLQRGARLAAALAATGANRNEPETPPTCATCRHSVYDDTDTHADWWCEQGVSHVHGGHSLVRADFGCIRWQPKAPE